MPVACRARPKGAVRAAVVTALTLARTSSPRWVWSLDEAVEGTRDRSVVFVLRILCSLLNLFFAARYDRDASRYHKGVYKCKRADPLTSVDAVLPSLFIGQLKNLHQACLGEFKVKLSEGLKDEGGIQSAVVERTRECEGRFEECTSEAVVVGDNEGREEEKGLWEWGEVLGCRGVIVTVG